MSSNIHATSVIEDGAEIGPDCEIGPFCHVGREVKLGANARLRSHVVIAGNTEIGPDSNIYPFTSIGHDPQDLKYAGEPNGLVIGSNCVIREGVTMNPGTAGDQGTTRIGDNCLFLAYSHVAHDCQVGNHVIMSNSVMLAGHCKIGDHVIIGGGAGIHQFCRIGNNAFIGGLAGVENDVIPFGMALGNRAYLGGLNLVGMKRAGIERDSIHKARKAFRALFSGEDTIQDAVERVEGELGGDPQVAKIIRFIREGQDRALCTPLRVN